MAAQKRIHVIACGVLAIDIRRTAQALGLRVTSEYLPGGLHSHPRQLRETLQEAVDRASAAGLCDRIVVGYGICGRGTLDIHARNIPLAIPRVHDCIALFLGSDAAYREQFARCPGTYYVSAGWFEEKVQPSAAPDDGQAPQPCPTHDAASADRAELERLTAKYGPENAQAILTFMTSWRKNYQRAAFVDTGSGQKRRYADYARAMAEEFGWNYEELPGNLGLIEKLLGAERTSAEVLIVPPHHVTRYDAVAGGLAAAPVWQREPQAQAQAPAEPVAPELPPDPQVKIGLGIDAGGTYTDVVIHDFATDSLLAKAKALTTKWDYTVGIGAALAQLDEALLERVDLVAISTTLATNAIVEGYGQKVGLLLMPPYGLYDPADVEHAPQAALRGRLEINGREIEPVDPEQVAEVACEMVQRQEVRAFAVSGFASTVNPAHELAVKRAVREATGLSVTCGHELSELLNFRTRARTAVLNARIIPRLEKFLREARQCLNARGISAPMVVVKGDGSLMSTEAAAERPVETMLSGPAASVAGARHMTRLARAVVVDIGGTTTDTAALRDGAVRTCASGTRVGGIHTHVRALEMRTTGLGGDSHVALENGQIRIGPRRVAPAAWLGSERPEAVARALDFLEANLADYLGTTRPMQIVALTGHVDSLALSRDEQAVVQLLGERPAALDELARRAGPGHWSLLGLDRLEEHAVIQRCSLTPTDLLHVAGRFQRWDTATAHRLAELVAAVAGLDVRAFAERALDQFVRLLAVEMIKKQLDDHTDGDAVDDCPACQAMLKNILDGGDDAMAVAVTVKSPLVGIGAPAHYFLPKVAEMLGTEAVIPPDADVANAVGAITSEVVVLKHVEVRPTDTGAYVVEGLPGARQFQSFDAAHEYAAAELRRVVQQAGRASGTSATHVDLAVQDRIGRASDGMEIFLGRVLTARLAGRPDLARLEAPAAP